MTDICFANARLILRSDVRRGGVLLRDGVIADIFDGHSTPKGAVDCHCDYLAPGLIELHTDNIERQALPRPGIAWPLDAALLAHDRELVGTGVTTAFDALRMGLSQTREREKLRPAARDIADGLRRLKKANALRASHFLHLRAELCTESLADDLNAFEVDDAVALISLMDHTPGQRQFRDKAKFKTYVTGKGRVDEANFNEYYQDLACIGARYAKPNSKLAIAASHRLGATLASHDDTRPQDVAEAATYGARISEFPTTFTAAQACRHHGIAIMMGAPNIIRGVSHSGNIGAIDLAERDLLDILSSDYLPSALLWSVVKLGDIWSDQARAFQTASLRPASAMGLEDRGEIAIGKRADLLRFSLYDQMPILKGVWIAGQRAA